MTDKGLEKADSKKGFMEMVEALRPDLLYPDSWSDSQQKIFDKVYKGTQNTTTSMFSSIPMTCSPKCPIRSKCPLYEDNSAPFGEKCPYELNWVRDFMTNFMQELNVESRKPYRSLSSERYGRSRNPIHS